jgi:hypothetical protein
MKYSSNLWEESLNSDGYKQFYQDQQNEQSLSPQIIEYKKDHATCLFCYMIYLALFRPVLGADPGVCFGSVVKSLQGTVVSIPSFHLHLSIARVLDK